MNETTNLGRVTHTMAIVYGLLFTLGALSTCLIASLSNVKWAALDGQAKFLIVVVIAGNLSSNLMAFLSKTMARLEAGKPAIPTNGDTTILTKADVPPTPKP